MMKLKYLFLMLLLLIIGGLYAQDSSALVTVDMSSYPKEVWWSSDSKRISFFEYISSDQPQVNMADENWIEFDITSGTLSRYSRWSLQPLLSTEEKQLLDPAVGKDGEESLIFESPSGNYLVCVCGGVTLYDRNRQTLQHLNYSVVDPFMGTDEFSVIWSKDESAFVYSTLDNEYGDFLSSFYIYGYQSDLKNIEVIEVEPQIQGKIYRYLSDEYPNRQKVYDLSDDGKWVLLLSRLDDPAIPLISQLPLYLIVWNTQNPDESYLLDNVKPETIKGMSFVGDTHSELLIVNEDGLIHYDLLTSTQSVIDASIQPSHAYFSPDSRYLALTCCDETIEWHLTILDLQEAVSLPTTSP